MTDNEQQRERGMTAERALALLTGSQCEHDGNTAAITPASECDRCATKILRQLAAAEYARGREDGLHTRDAAAEMFRETELASEREACAATHADIEKAALLKGREECEKGHAQPAKDSIIGPYDERLRYD